MAATSVVLFMSELVYGGGCKTLRQVGAWAVVIVWGARGEFGGSLVGATGCKAAGRDALD
jgi:hypothetical protein